MDLVRAARAEEVSYMEGRNIWTVCPMGECLAKTGKKPVSVRWVDTDKGFMSEGGMEVRSRLVARDFKGVARVAMTYSQGAPRWKLRGCF